MPFAYRKEETDFSSIGHLLSDMLTNMIDTNDLTDQLRQQEAVILAMEDVPADQWRLDEFDIDRVHYESAAWHIEMGIVLITGDGELDDDDFDGAVIYCSVVLHLHNSNWDFDVVVAEQLDLNEEDDDEEAGFPMIRFLYQEDTLHDNCDFRDHLLTLWHNSAKQMGISLISFVEQLAESAATDDSPAIAAEEELVAETGDSVHEIRQKAARNLLALASALRQEIANN
jgi:hypothetical protein